MESVARLQKMQRRLSKLLYVFSVALVTETVPIFTAQRRGLIIRCKNIKTANIRLKAVSLFRVCMTSDFFLEEADEAQ